MNDKKYDISNIKGFRGYYRVRLGDYRIGFKKEREFIVFMRVKHRKDIYKNFP
jgi:mRNA-degrading endonuclease RelE of RelBE toxin-antitoxin system